ncbi:MAG TPA: YidC/Oxa1 family membrane protein insertase [Mollicutes bacterium]|nr:YidC/Oxa1 family membrane protein insertase [Mollicutes bacterium]
MKKKTKVIILILLFTLFVSGCGNSKYLTDKDNKRIINEATGQSLRTDILCKPENKDTLKIYEEAKEDLDIEIEKLPDCKNIKIYDSDHYTGLWANLFVIPLAWVIIKVGLLVKNYGIAIMLVGILIRVVLTPLTIKTAKQNQNMVKAQPELDRLEKKYEGKDDSDAMMQKSQEMLAIYKKHKINPVTSCLTAFIQLPLFLAFLQAVNRIPAIFEEKLFTLELGKTPLVGLKDGNYFYIILILLIIATTYFSFKYSMNSSSGSTEQKNQMKFMTNFMLVFISIASFSLPTAIAFYWVSTNAFVFVQNYIIRKRSS